ncbi:Myb-like DNA-binding domain-containing protein [Desmospora activa]|uniref:Myb-like DNA-binding protein n=1 Tax=Desmospora activa DSM 45169 TaxID=1121389 RepID=A0A2T4ZDL5_9BACL|nr:Myb-like DNA-binding domain-containing protein [Desmospora activa]PTM59980.1 Myb-like DNA-binding protein [Desmospora activa DSM 45169]
MSRSWTPEEDRNLLHWVAQCKKTGMSRTQTFDIIGERLERSSNACYLRWKSLINRKGIEPGTAIDKLSEWSHEYQKLKERLNQLEQQVGSNDEKMEQWIRESRKLREEMRFFETLLLEEYQLLLNLLNKNNRSARLHQAD